MNDEQRGITTADIEQLEARLGLRIEAAVNKAMYELTRWFVTVTISVLGAGIAAAFVIARYVR